MSEHPDRERLADYAQDAMPESGTGAIEKHLAQCRECAWLVEGYRIEERHMAAALAEEPPLGLSERILSAATRKGRPRLLRWAAAAVLLISLTALAVLYRQGSEAKARARELEGRLAAAERKASETGRWAQLCRAELECHVADLAVWAELTDEGAALVRKSLTDTLSQSAETFERAWMGEEDMEGLLAKDTLAHLDADLRALLGEREYRAVSERMAKTRGESMERAAEGFLRDLESMVGLTTEQRASLKRHLVARSAWRQDLAILPDFARRHLLVHLLRGDAELRPEVRAELSASQEGRLLAFLEREGQGYRKLCEQVIKRPMGSGTPDY